MSSLGDAPVGPRDLVHVGNNAELERMCVLCLMNQLSGCPTIASSNRKGGHNRKTPVVSLGLVALGVERGSEATGRYLANENLADEGSCEIVLRDELTRGPGDVLNGMTEADGEMPGVIEEMRVNAVLCGINDGLMGESTVYLSGTEEHDSMEISECFACRSCTRRIRIDACRTCGSSAHGKEYDAADCQEASASTMNNDNNEDKCPTLSTKYDLLSTSECRFRQARSADQTEKNCLLDANDLGDNCQSSERNVNNGNCLSRQDTGRRLREGFHGQESPSSEILCIFRQAHPDVQLEIPRRPMQSTHYRRFLIPAGSTDDIDQEESVVEEDFCELQSSFYKIVTTRKPIAKWCTAPAA